MNGNLSKSLATLLVVAGLIAALTGQGATESIWSEDKRFKDNGDRTVTDTQTGLMWMQADSYIQAGSWLTWFEAIKFIAQLNGEGFTDYHDWRAPTVKELQSLYEAEKVNSKQVGREMTIHIDPIFTKDGSGSLWSGEENGNYNAFGVVLNTGQRFSSSKKSKSRRAIRAVRYTN